MRYILSTLVLIIFFIFSPFLLEGKIVYVDSSNITGLQNGLSWSTAYAGFQGGVSAASAGDTVWIAKGTYQPAFSTSFTMKAGVKIYGGFTNGNTSFLQRNVNGNITRLKGNGNSVIRNVNNNLDSNAVLDGFTISGGFSTSSTLGVLGGGIYNSNTSPKIENCIFSGNRANYGFGFDCGGGGIYNTGSRPIIRACTFFNNSAADFNGAGKGGAIFNFNSSSNISYCTFDSNWCRALNYNEGGAIYETNSSGGSAKSKIDNCIFIENEVSRSGRGGAIYTTCESIISNSIFASNRSMHVTSSTSANGGAIYFFGSLNDTLSVVNCNFSNNAVKHINQNPTLSNGSGGAISNLGGVLFVKGSTFNFNTTRTGGAIYSSKSLIIDSSKFIGQISKYGGALYIDQSSPLSQGRIQLKNTEFFNDTAIYGGAIYSSDFLNYEQIINNCLFTRCVADSLGGAIYNKSTLQKIVNSSIGNNKAIYGGGGIYNLSNSNCKVINSILWGNNSGMLSDGTSVSYAAYSLVQGFAASLPDHTLDGLTTNPFFVDTLNNNYQLLPNSPCINSGRNDSIPSGGTVDLANNPRINCTNVDMGAYEHNVGNAPLALLGNDTVICSGISLTLSVQGVGANYLWSNNATTSSITVNTSGKYYVTVTNCLGTSSDTINVTVSSNIAPTISISGTSNICSGISNTYTALTNVSGGTIQWKVNGNNVGMNSTTYSYTPVNGDIVTAEVTTPSSSCYTVGNATSNAITMIVTPSVTPSVSITGNTSLCSGANTTYTATTNITGASYQWKVNNNNVGTNTGTYTYTPVNNDQITCDITAPSSGCYTASVTTSNTLTVTVTPYTTPTLSITTGSSNVCSGTPVTYTATTNITGGSYQWQVNSINVGTNTNSYSYNPANGDIVSCILTTPAAGCFTSNNVSSNTVTMTVTPTITPNISIAESNNNVCLGTSVTYTATTNIVGASYQWKLNNINVGSNTSTYSHVPVNNDVITCEITVPGTGCYSVSNVTSNAITMNVLPVITPLATVTGNSTVCQGASEIYTASTNVSGASYQWKVNSINVGSNTATYAYTPLNSDIIECIVSIPGTGCYTASSVNSNPLAISVQPVVTPTLILNGPSGGIQGSQITINAAINNAPATYSIDWLNNGVVFATTSVPSVTYIKTVGTDMISALLTTSVNCYNNNNSDTITVSDVTGVASLEKRTIEVYPNPFTNYITVNGLSGKYTVTLINTIGQAIESWESSSSKQTFYISDVASGLYLLRIKNVNGESINVSLLKQ